MPTLIDVKKMVTKLGKGSETLGTKREIKCLPEILQDNEIILALTSGLMEGNTWLITCTNKRIIFLDKGLIYGLKQIEIPLNKVNSIQHETGLFLGEISILDGSGKTSIRNIPKRTVTHFTNNANIALQNLKENSAQQSSAADSTGDLISQLERLGDLVKKGILTEAEFQAKKQKILESA
jgi:hypothetical protein